MMLWKSKKRINEQLVGPLELDGWMIEIQTSRILHNAKRALYH
jgi:hypothetical protein